MAMITVLLSILLFYSSQVEACSTKATIRNSTYIEEPLNNVINSNTENEFDNMETKCNCTEKYRYGYEEQNITITTILVIILAFFLSFLCIESYIIWINMSKILS